MARESKPSNMCPCGSGKLYSDCCGRFHDGKAVPETPEQLMRSRYSAFVVKNPMYLLDTWHPTARPSELNLADPVKWLSLKIKSTGFISPDEGFVHFIARGLIAGRGFKQEEKSRFLKENGRWFYVDGILS